MAAQTQQFASSANLIRNNPKNYNVSETLLILFYWNDQITTPIKLISGVIVSESEIVTERNI